MPLFSRSDRADRKHKSSGRFSFRKHEPADALASSASSSASSSAGRRARDGAKPPPAPAPAPAAPKPLSASVASTTGSSVSSSRLSASVRSSTSTARSTSPTIVESLSGDTDTGSDTEARDSTDDDPRMAARGASQPPPPPLRQQRQSQRQSQHGAASPGSARSVRSSLVDYRQLQCSMSYKNRLESQQRSAPGALRASEDRARGSLDDPQFLATTPSSVRSSSRASEALADGPDAADTPPRSSRSSIGGRLSLSVAPRPSEDAAAPDRRSEPRMTEANVAAMQTRRAFQQLTLAAASDDSDLSDDSDDDSDLSDSDSSSSGRFPRRAAAAAAAAASVSATSSMSARSGVVKLGADEYRKFQFRLRQLEDLCQEQARKQAFMDEAIEREVELRTRKVVAAMDKKIEMYRQAKALECEREVARRVSEMDVRGSSSRGSLSLRRSLLQSSSAMSSSMSLAGGGGPRPSFSSSLSSIPDSELKGKPLDKIFHPRRARARKVERLREMEEQQKREMEQFRAFIQSTEGGAAGLATPLSGGGREPAAAHADVDELLRRDPPPTADELLELVAVLRGHVDVQETQLDEAKRLISAAIDAREAAERMAEEAVALTVQLDSRLDRASREMTWVRDELRRSMSLGPEQFSARASRVLSAPLFFSGAAPPDEPVETPDEPVETPDETRDEDEDKRARIAAAAGR